MTVIAASAARAQAYGEVFTRRWVVDALLDLVGYTTDRDLGALVLVEPSAGSGAFLLPAIERLVASAERHGRDLSSLGPAIRAWELQAPNAAACRRFAHELLVSHGADSQVADRLAREWMIEGDFLRPDDDLFSAGSGQVEADIVVGNPPYIRLEDLPPAHTASYRRRWTTMGGRADIYVGFFERSLSILRPEGRLGFICADRWMRNQYGANLRQHISKCASIEAVWVMHDVDAFESQVSAYPAITVLRKGRQGPVLAADANENFGEAECRNLLAWSVSENREAEFQDESVSAYRLPHWFPGDESWPTGSPARLRLIEHLNDTFYPLHDPRTKTRVGIGVATGADKIFVTSDSDAVEAERLLPLAMVRDLATGQFQWSGQYLVDPWGLDGKLIELSDYPKMAAYLHDRGSELRERFVARRAPESWFRTIDKVDHSLVDRPKLLLQDMRTTIHPVLERGGCYPHHNLYYVVSDTWDMEVLGGILLSRIAQAFIEAYCVRMRGGTLRFQAQYLRRIRVPAYHELSEPVRLALATAFRDRDVPAATAAALDAYKLDSERLLD
ncbi:Eco57I restriction-modification methylase domain-containing protein [Pseudonocardia asaccharolytica]|uniref:site-specific DNA-methyltransferase (adenine-specific) n=1 Tax=Pseudonocardia asaccharolytica DSM 44247 = NBRC 16224 TaxID=1123024 RepID=A0A511D481_9PSEU|nr:Eco57I restriction-modification methylase domain-containing protein [Pseudonocardia asaccharolytica]GEL19585.1 type II DNA modification methyltransferase [Pseudonocardia asaccharolytica DSM 44247 = NBRC 16224]